MKQGPWCIWTNPVTDKKWKKGLSVTVYLARCRKKKVDKKEPLFGVCLAAPRTGLSGQVGSNRLGVEMARRGTMAMWH